MRTLRLWLLLLLAVLLPLRGALAAGVLCASGVPQGLAPAAMAPLQTHHAGHAHDPARPAHAHLAPAEPGHDAPAGPHAHGDDGKCNACAVLCCVPALPTAALVMGAATPAEAVFPPAFAPATSFIAEGPERPPRST